MQKLKVAASPKIRNILDVEREVLDLNSADLTEISAVVIDLEDYRNGRLKRVDASAFGLPIFLMLNANEETPKELIGRIVGVINDEPTNRRLYARQIDEAALRYESKVLPPFFDSLNKYVRQGKASSTARDIRAALITADIRPAARSMISSVKKSSAPTCATPTFPWVTF